MVPFGLRDGKLYAPEQVVSGRACECVCPGCGAELVAKKGKEKRWHFSHLNVHPGESCAESAIHAAAKQVLLEHGELAVPEFAIDVAARAITGQELYEHEILSPARRIRFDRTAPEVTIGDVRPDVVGYRGERQLLVEMYFRHRVDDAKRDKLMRLGLPALEIDLSHLDAGNGFEPLVERVINSVLDKEWLVYPQSEAHRAYLEDKLRVRIEVANDAHRKNLAQKRKERERLAQLEKTRRISRAQIDDAFSSWTPEEQEAWLRQQLGLNEAIPVFLSRQSYPSTVIRIPSFLFQASIFERFIYGAREGTTLTAMAIYPCLRRRFDLDPGDGPYQRLAVNLYLEYLTHTRFLSRDRRRELRGPYHVEHNAVSMPAWTPEDSQYDGEPLLPALALGSGPRRRWTNRWPRWRSVIDEARQVLADSTHRDLLLNALEGLSAMTPPASPHHWALPLLEQGVELEYCFDVLCAVGLIAD
jgi:hypothetical protein